MQIVLERIDEARKMIAFRDARRIVRQSAFRWNHIPPHAGDTVVIVGFSSVNLTRSVNLLKIAVQHAVPYHVGTSAALRKGIVSGRGTAPDGYSFSFVVIHSVQPDFAHGSVAHFMQNSDAFHAAGAIHFGKLDDRGLATGIFH